MRNKYRIKFTGKGLCNTREWEVQKRVWLFFWVFEGGAMSHTEAVSMAWRLNVTEPMSLLD